MASARYVDNRLVVRFLDPTWVVIRSGFAARERLLRDRQAHSSPSSAIP